MKKATKKHLSELGSLADELHSRLQEVFDDLSEAISGRSEKWFESEKGEAAQAEVDEAETLVSIAEDLAVRIASLADGED